MGKVLPRSNICPHCGKSLRNSQAVSTHIAQTPTCSSARHKDRQVLAATIQQLRDEPSASPNPPTPTSSSYEHGLTSEDVEVMGLEQEDPPPACRSCSVTIEEEVDQDMPLQPQWGPHPLAIPTRQSLFPEPHPDPTAGMALRWEPIDEQPPPNYNTVLEDPEIFEEAHWLANLPISDEQRDQFFKLRWNRSKEWENVRQFNKEIDNLPHGPEWHRQTIEVKGDLGDEILDLWLRDIVGVVKQLLKDRRFVKYMRFAPERHWESVEHQVRVYDEMWSGDWWWRVQNLLGENATIVPLILATDKTQLSVFSGNKQAWPVYLTIGNIGKDIRRRPSQRATILVGYIPVSKLSGISNETKRSEQNWQLFHTAMERILAPLKKLSICGEDMVCADGGVRRVHPILASYIADFPEQCTVTCVRESRCPICWVPTNQRGDFTKRYDLRSSRQTLDALKDKWGGYSIRGFFLGFRALQTWRRAGGKLGSAGAPGASES